MWVHPPHNELGFLINGLAVHLNTEPKYCKWHLWVPSRAKRSTCPARACHRKEVKGAPGRSLSPERSGGPPLPRLVILSEAKDLLFSLVTMRCGFQALAEQSVRTAHR